jgi:hypothetical protein
MTVSLLLYAEAEADRSVWINGSRKTRDAAQFCAALAFMIRRVFPKPGSVPSFHSTDGMKPFSVYAFTGSRVFRAPNA